MEKFKASKKRDKTYYGNMERDTMNIFAIFSIPKAII